MKYNCLRINQYVKMFVVGLLLYFGETVFQNATEETFTLYVKTLTGTIIKVSGCKKNDMLSGFMKKFEKAYTEKINDWKIKNSQPADIPVLPVSQNSPIKVRLTPYDQTEQRVTMFPRINKNV